MHPDLTANSEAIDEKKKPGLLSVKPVLYIILLVMSIYGTYAYKLRVDGIFACSADGYASDRYLADCNAGAYGDYDHGAFWFGLEPDAQRFVANAEVLFLGSSQLQFALSTPATVDWFSSPKASYYLLGFTHTENVNFVNPLFEKLNPQAKVYVINVDRFFHSRETPPAAEIFHGKGMRDRYAQKQLWQSVHRSICTLLPAICGNQLTVFRSRENGNWILKGSAGLQAADVSDGPATNQEQWDDFAAIGQQFISKLPVEHDCIVLTLAPWAGTRRAEATAIARALGLNLIAPNLEDLVTYDGTHLDLPSRERWAMAFFDAAGPQIRQCLNKPEQSRR